MKKIQKYMADDGTEFSGKKNAKSMSCYVRRQR